MPTLARDKSRIMPGLGVIATAPAYARLSADGLLGDALVVGEGRIGNLERGTLVLGEGTKKIP